MRLITSSARHYGKCETQKGRIVRYNIYTLLEKCQRIIKETDSPIGKTEMILRLLDSLPEDWNGFARYLEMKNSFSICPEFFISKHLRKLESSLKIRVRNRDYCMLVFVLHARICIAYQVERGRIKGG